MKDLAKESLIKFIYSIGKFGLLSHINPDECTLVFEPIRNISGRDELNLRREYHRNLTMHHQKHNSIRIHKKSSVPFVDIRLDVANRKTVTIPVEGICTENGIKTVQMLVKNGYRCAQSVNDTKPPCNEVFHLGKCKQVTLSHKVDLIVEKVAILRPLLEMTNVKTATIVMLDKSLSASLYNDELEQLNASNK